MHHSFYKNIKNYKITAKAFQKNIVWNQYRFIRKITKKKNMQL